MATKKLLIVESPAKAGTIKKYLGKDYTVMASMGHIIDLPKSQMGIDFENDYTPKYITISGKGKLLTQLKKEAKKADVVYLATDPDREGEAISWHLAEALKIDPESNCRVTFNEITKTAVKAAIKQPRKIDMDLVDAQQARRVLDRIVGYTISPILWEKVKRGLSAGRVQSVATKLICDREEEIENFTPQEYWSIETVLNDPKSKKDFNAKYYGEKGKEVKLNNAEETKMMSADELEEKAVTGCVVIDNITLAEQDTTSPTAAPEATTQPTEISYVADFETADTKFASGKTWGGFKNKSNDYQDYIKAKWLQDGGVDGSTAFCVYYQSATYYAGEIFVPAPAVWTNNGAKGAEYLNFDYKGKGAVKISFSTGNTVDGTLTSGTRYTRRFELDSHGDWAKISVPLSEFVNGENIVNMTEIGTVTFQAAENANLDNNSDDTKAMSADELKEIARTGEIIFDNMTLSETEGKTTLFSSVKVTAEIDGKEITNLTNGDIKIKAIASDIEKDTNMVMIVAVYKENGVIDTVRMAGQKIIGDGELMLDLNVTDAEHQTMKVFIFDDFTNLHPIINVTNFL
mgnify:CR=1 FL=1